MSNWICFDAHLVVYILAILRLTPPVERRRQYGKMVCEFVSVCNWCAMRVLLKINLINNYPKFLFSWKVFRNRKNNLFYSSSFSTMHARDAIFIVQQT